ncbi:MAG: hypothetical protein QF513_01000 [Gammaproteobacteria bacterium]|nr:hypothetical protein [Gammaproteobacteria bacterium]MDP6146358.1 hypothetical protein [Gammaproteobacteria bacterium]HJL80750.1 hypothetical protein [Gammaproteobacteria bacterium]HJN01306.1 hypothetical protein [Gammaproteobacteria bacterium]
MQSLQKGLVKLSFTSMNSGEGRTIVCTLNERLLRNHQTMTQDLQNDNILVFKTESNEWEDVRLDTVTSWEEVLEA